MNDQPNVPVRGVAEGQHLWSPRPEFAQGSNLARYMRWLEDERGRRFSGYDALWEWSVRDLEGFWQSIWDYFDVHSISPPACVLDTQAMPGAKWFPGARLNYAEHILRHEAKVSPDQIAIRHLSECRPLAAMTWHELGRQVRVVATQLRHMGVGSGDRVVSYMPNIPETTVAMLATVSIGAIWSSAAPEFGVNTVIDRFSQIKPKVLFAADGYRFGGKDFDRTGEVAAICDALPSLQEVIWLPYLNLAARPPKAALSWAELMDHPVVPREAFEYAYVKSDHPLWILFSSGTTGLPKAIVPGHGGVTLEHLKLMHFHLNITPDSTMFFYTTTGWVMWNILLAAMIGGGAVVLYDGHPAHPAPDLLWKLAADTGATCFGASPTFVQLMEKAGLEPGKSHDLSALETIVVSGAPSTPETFAWFYRSVKQDLWVTSQSGGTEIVSGFVGAAPTLPVHAGEIQCRSLGMDVHAWDEDGIEVPAGTVGELVVTSPFPSMPVKFWNDDGDARYKDAYFDVYPGVWRHGDFLKINERGGCYIYGRSDSTLNRFGVRIGTAEIYRVVEQVEGVADSLIVCCELPGGRYDMPLFVQMKPGVTFSDEVADAIRTRLRSDCSPRHVPDSIHAVPTIPYTLTGKKMEIPVRKLLTGTTLEKAASRDAMQDPAAIDFYVRFAREHARERNAA